MTVNVDPFIRNYPIRWTNQDGGLSEEANGFMEYLVRFLRDLRERTGGATDIINEINQTLNTNVEQITSGAELLSIANDLNDITPHPVDELTWTKRILTIDATAGPRDIYELRLGKTVFMERFPGINSELIAINGDGTLINVDGNGNNIKIDGIITDSVNWQTESKSIHFHWFEDGPYWVGI